MTKSCVFFGHRWLAFKVEERRVLKKTIINLITKENVEDFIFGCYGDFDSTAFEVVSEIKKDYPKIRRILALAYIPRYQADSVAHIQQRCPRVYLNKSRNNMAFLLDRQNVK
ncbi:MAG: hypothetical protein ACI4OR_00700 [Alphaproteobacteria bacterium]